MSTGPAAISSRAYRPRVGPDYIDAPFTHSSIDHPMTPHARIAACLAGFILSAAASAFEYAGVGVGADPGSLREQFPSSKHEFWTRGTGSIVRPEDGGGRFEAQLKDGDGLYIVKLAPDDTRGDVTAVSVSLDRGRVRRWILSFERPALGNRPEEVEARYPGCKRLLDSVSERYGPPGEFATRIERGVQHRLRTWTSPAGVLRLACAKYVTRTAIYALDIEIVPTTP
jgi:hypothetical protein